ncbi:MAG: hypothetical protein LBK61_03785, partial [Spirochaetaceae bacterium]|nr:hypothetical protein [Spirochaetaceae bacterium]
MYFIIFSPFVCINLTLFYTCESRSAPAECPCGGRKPFGFSSRCETCPDLKPIPILAEESAAGRQNTVMRRLCFPFGRAMPPHDGILPAGDDAGLGR